MSHDTQLRDDDFDVNDKREPMSVWEYEPERLYQITEAARIYGQFKENAKPERAVKLFYKDRKQIKGSELAQKFEKWNISCRMKEQRNPEKYNNTEENEKENLHVQGIALPHNKTPETNKILNIVGSYVYNKPTSYSDIIGINNQECESEIIPFVTFANLTRDQLDLIHDYIATEIEGFKSASGESDISYIPYNKTIALDCDFMAKNMEYFYEVLFGDIHRGADGRVHVSKKIAVTFDKKSAPISIDPFPYRCHQHNRPTERRYGSIDINGYHSKENSDEHRVCYYFYLPLQEILELLKNK